MFIRSNDIQLRDWSGNKAYIHCKTNQGVDIFYDNTKRLETTNTGITVTGTAVATSFTGDLTGDVTGNASGSSGSCTGNAATATALETARNIGGVSFDGSANIDLPGVNSAGNQDTTGNAATATALETARTIGGTSFDGTANIVPAEATNADTVDSLHASSFIRSDADDSYSGTITANSDASNPVLKIQGAGPNFIQFASDASGTVDADSINFIYRSSTNTLAYERASDDTIMFSIDADNAAATFGGAVNASSGFVGDVTGNADTATTLATARNIGGVSFNGSANINLPGVNSAGNQNTSGTAAGLSGTPNITVGTITGSSATFGGESLKVHNATDDENNTFVFLRAWENGDDDDRNVFKHVTNNVIKSQITKRGGILAHDNIEAGKTRTDANAPTTVYDHGGHSFIAYSGKTNDTANFRTRIFIRAWDGGDTGDRNIIYHVDSGSDTTTANANTHQKFGVKANGMIQGGSNIFAGRVESDQASPTSQYLGANGTTIIVYPNSANQNTRIDARTTDNSQQVYRADTGGGVVIKFESDGDGRFDGGADIGNASDYAEYFEWADGNTSSADRRGMTVILDGEKIRPATDSDDTSKIIGVVSAKPAVVGDSAWSEWQLAHLKDAYGSWVTKDEEWLVWNKFGTFIDTDGVEKTNPQPDINDHNLSAEYEILVSDIDAEKAKGNVPQAAIDQNLRFTRPSRTYNPDYDPTRTYVPRSERKEWDAIGLMGKLVVRRGQPIGANWILMKSNVGTDPNDNSIILDKYLVR